MLNADSLAASVHTAMRLPLRLSRKLSTRAAGPIGRSSLAIQFRFPHKGESRRSCTTGGRLSFRGDQVYTAGNGPNS